MGEEPPDMANREAGMLFAAEEDVLPGPGGEGSSRGFERTVVKNHLTELIEQAGLLWGLR
jgi:hypothetical protein